MKATRRLLFAFCFLALFAGGCSKKKPTAVSPEEAPRSSGAAAPAAPSKNAAGQAPSAAPDATAPVAPGLPPPPADATAASTSAPAPSEGIPADLAAQDAAYDAWFKKHNLDLSDPAMLDEDPDGDGFTNREEFLADTNPRDAKAHPDPASGIRLKEFVRKDLPVVVRAVQGQTAEIERVGGDGVAPRKRETVKAGQTIAGSNYKVLRVEKRDMRDKDGNLVDGSRVTIEDAQSRQRIDLVKDTPARSTASYAVLTSPDGKTTIQVHDGETFTWPGEKPVTYKVKDLRDEQVILEEVSTGKIVTVPKG